MHPAIKPVLFLLCLAPFCALVAAALLDTLGPDPAEALLHETGEWAARLLIATLLVSPLRAWTGWGPLIRLRRMLGLFCFFYATVHLVIFLQFYLGWSGERVLEEVLERPYITVGFLAWLILVPLAVTSNKASQRRLRGDWRRLHLGSYAVAITVSLHYLWQSRSDIGEALVYTVIFALLLAWRARRQWWGGRALEGS
jgi:sulfoxide reductase heme-binding subunit YedZ